jgi:hypothetical protein
MKKLLVLQKQVYASIEADLTFCSENLPLTTTQKGDVMEHLLRRKAFVPKQICAKRHNFDRLDTSGTYSLVQITIRF